MERPNLIRAIGAGVVATLLMTGALFLTPLVSEPRGFFPMIGSIGGITDARSANFAFWWGIIWHVNIGAILYPNLYVLAGYPILPGKSPWVKGACWGVLLAGLAMTIGTSLMGFGFLASNTNSPFLVCLAILGLHLLYGIVFGGLTGKAKEDAAIEEDGFQSAHAA